MTTIPLREPYVQRDIQFLELWQHDSWRMKLYGIAYHKRSQPDAELIASAKRLAQERLEESGDPFDNYGVGFIIIHCARVSNFVLIDWWCDENVLCSHLYGAPIDRPGYFRYSTPSGLMACVWELEVVCFERTAWMHEVLMNPQGADVEAYLARRFNGKV